MFLLNKTPHIAILLATKNGAGYLCRQMQSYVEQTHKNWSLHVSDDGSSDGTPDIIRKFSESSPQAVALHQGPKRGIGANFMSLAKNSAIEADYFAFSDQDDVWCTDKLERAMSWFKTIPLSTPALYCSRTELIDRNGEHKGYSRLFKKHPSFRNALVQNIAGGNTMIFNKATKNLLEKAGDIEFSSHDWLTYQIVSSVSGIVYYDEQHSIQYRQHSENFLGTNNTFFARLQRLRMLFANRMKDWNDLNLGALNSLRPHIAAENLRVLDDFTTARNADHVVARLRHLRRSGVYRQTFFGNLGIFIAAIFKKL